MGKNVIILDLVKSQTWGNVIDRKHLICQCGLLIWDRETLIVYIGPHLPIFSRRGKTHYGSFNGSFIIRVEWGETLPLQDCVIFFWKTKVKCVQKSFHRFSDTDINYKPSMKNKFCQFWKYNYICIKLHGLYLQVLLLSYNCDVLQNNKL